jgi:zinc transport system permease protein
MVTLMVAASTRALGALPVFAFSVLPVIAALLAVRTMALALPLASVLGLLSGAEGYLIAFFLIFPAGASQTVVAGTFVVLAVPVRLLRGSE